MANVIVGKKDRINPTVLLGDISFTTNKQIIKVTAQRMSVKNTLLPLDVFIFFILISLINKDK